MDTSSQAGTRRGRGKDLVEHWTYQATRIINSASPEAARERVQTLRQTYPDATPEALVEQLIKQKSLQTAGVGLLTAGASAVPGLGTLATLTLGTAADIGITLRMQTELALEIAALYGHDLPPERLRNVIMLITGISLGGERLVGQAGRRVAEGVAERLASRSAVKALPIVGALAAGAINAVTTYVIGRRAHAYFSLGPEAMPSWEESLRAITGVDERKIVTWLEELVDGLKEGARSRRRHLVDSLRRLEMPQLLPDLNPRRLGEQAAQVVWTAGGDLRDRLARLGRRERDHAGGQEERP
ncbi:hypothetical protein FKZ61_008750 [Litorilinea aerophila]|uniref:EcsC family protein n=1 Tax=Litorilinea aerophila TaxID=1204385 RepID=A0A540VHI0_9CHLR|nr:hypothetical protein [Litorilinea aerophila]MCC9076198.1 hypothetical protein [Litorilinea aerophila]GIV78898.1 MAG: hypothetical protein KatS3mg050_3292 [Litorilinea sp.]